MVESLRGEIVPVDLPFDFSPSGPGIEVLAFEEHFDAYVIAGGYAPSLEAANRRECTALLTFKGTLQLSYGYPNEEAFFADPRGHLGHGVSEILGSEWLSTLDSYNRASFGSALSERWAPRHFFVGAKDASAQFLADAMEIEIFDDVSASAARAAARGVVTERVLGTTN